MPMKFALGIEYDGRPHCGWQSQANGCALQDKLEAALAALAQEPVATIAAGRTDAGVHAIGQVVHFVTTAQRPLTAWVRGVNAYLPESMRVLWAKPVAEDFHARFSATARTYRYILYNHGERPALHAGRVGWFHLPLDEKSMASGAQTLLGEHDFSSFRAAGCQARSPVRALQSADIARHGDYLLFSFTANAFLHHMIRNIVGSLVYVGAGRQPVDWLEQLLRARDRTQAAPTFAADGLYLSAVRYDARFDLPEASAAPLLLGC